MVVPAAQQLMRKRWLSVFGLVLCVPYAVLIVQCLRWAHGPQVDYKSRLVWKQLPVLLQSMVAEGLGLTVLLGWLPWAMAYVLMAAPMFVGLYLLGKVVEDTIRGHHPFWKDASNPGADK